MKERAVTVISVVNNTEAMKFYVRHFFRKCEKMSEAVSRRVLLRDSGTSVFL